MAESEVPGKGDDWQVKPSPRSALAIPGVIASILVGAIVLMLPTPEALSPEGHRMAALFAVALILFVTEAIPIAMTSVLVLMLQPMMGITDTIQQAFAAWLTPVFFFVLVMFVVAQAVSVTGLAKRFALWLLVLARNDSRRVVMVFVIGAGLMSLIMSDVPACAIFMAIGLGIIEKMKLKPGSNFAKALMIGIPIGALIGGVGMPWGSSINLLGLDQLEQATGIRVGVGEWMLIGMPMVIILLPLAAFIISRFYPPEVATIGNASELQADRQAMGPIGGQEARVALILGTMVTLWILGIWWPSIFDVYLIGIGGAVALFLPGINVLSWKQAQAGTGWDALLLVGGVTSLGNASRTTGLAEWMVNSSLGGIADWDTVWVIALISSFTVIVHLALPINPVIVIVLIPPLAILAEQTGVNPALYALPVAFTASCAFLLPIDAVPLLTYAKGYYKMFDMLPPGAVLSVIWVILMTAILSVVGPFLGYF